MKHLAWLVVATSSVLFGQLQNFGTDPDDKKRGEKMISQNENMIKQQQTAIRFSILAVIISVVSLLIAILRH